MGKFRYWWCCSVVKRYSLKRANKDGSVFKCHSISHDKARAFIDAIELAIDYNLGDISEEDMKLYDYLIGKENLKWK